MNATGYVGSPYLAPPDLTRPNNTGRWTPFEADPFDALEQRRAVVFDEDEYRS